MVWVRMRPLLPNWPASTEAPTFVVNSDANGAVAIELAWDPQALLSPAVYPQATRYYTTASALNLPAVGGAAATTVAAQTLSLTGGRLEWRVPDALWAAYKAEGQLSLSNPGATTFRRNVYFRVRFQATGSATPIVWPIDAAIRDNPDAPHMGLLMYQAGTPASTVAADDEAINAMTSPFGGMVRWLYTALPETDPARQALVAIFGHQVYRTELGTAAMRGKVLLLWLMAGRARMRLPQLLDRRYRNSTGGASPALVQPDLRGGATLVDNLLALATIVPNPDIAGHTSTDQLIDDVVTEILDPNGQSNQGQANTCSPTCLQTYLITTNASEYARLQTGLLSAAGQVTLANNVAVTVPPAIFQVTRYSATPPFTSRTCAEIAFQATVLKYALDTAFPAYDPAAPPNAANGVNTVFRATLDVGLQYAQTERGLRGVFNQAFTTNYVSSATDATWPNQATIQQRQPGLRAGFLTFMTGSPQPVMLALFWSAPYQFGHMVLAQRTEGGRVFFKNPQYPGSNPTAGIAAGGLSTGAVGGVHQQPPRRFDDPAGTVESMTEADLNTWIKGYWVPERFVG